MSTCDELQALKKKLLPEALEHAKEIVEGEDYANAIAAVEAIKLHAKGVRA